MRQYRTQICCSEKNQIIATAVYSRMIIIEELDKYGSSNSDQANINEAANVC